MCNEPINISIRQACLNYELARLPAAREQLRLDRQPDTFVRANALPLEFIRHSLGRGTSMTVGVGIVARTNKTNSRCRSPRRTALPHRSAVRGESQSPGWAWAAAPGLPGTVPAMAFGGSQKGFRPGCIAAVKRAAAS